MKSNPTKSQPFTNAEYSPYNTILIVGISAQPPPDYYLCLNGSFRKGEIILSIKLGVDRFCL